MKLQRPIARTMPEGGQARELFRDVLTDIAAIEYQAAKAVDDKHGKLASDLQSGKSDAN